MAVYVTRNTVFGATAAGGDQTILKLVTPTSFGIKIHAIKISMDGISSTAVPAVFEWGTSDETTAGTGSGTAVTTQIAGRAQAHGLTVTQNHSAEGTTYSIIDGLFVPQLMGFLILNNPLGLEEESPGDAADSFLLRVNVTADVNALASVKWSRA
jgi:hypothetical protein